MNKFIEHANRLKARLSLLSATSDYDDKHFSLMAEITKSTNGDPSVQDELLDLSLDTRVLLYEFNCLPLYEEACRHSDNPSYLVYLLDKMISVAGFRQQ